MSLEQVLADRIAKLEAEIADLRGIDHGFRGISATAYTGLGTNQPVFRSDLGIWTFYNSSTSQWLSQYEIAIPLPVQLTTGASSDYPNTRRALRSDYDLYFTRAEFTVDIGVTNTAVNNWTMRIVRRLIGGASAVIAEASTVGLTVSTTNQVVADTTVTNITGSTIASISLNVVRNGAPSEITFFATAYARLVIP